MAYKIDLSERNILITGASSGLGAHFAKVLGAAGANLALCARRVVRLEVLCKELSDKGIRAVPIEMDVSEPDHIQRGFNEAEAQLGEIHSVIANAGMNSEGMALSIDAAEFNRVLSVNLTGAFLTAREGASRMIAADSKTREHGRIVIISSITANKVDGGLAAYSASKAGALQLSKVLAREWATKGISVNVVCPGYIETDMNSDWFKTEGVRSKCKKCRVGA